MTLSKYRYQLFGLAALGVILCHSSAMMDPIPVLSLIFGYGTTGVYVFSLLSGLGLYYSMVTHENDVDRKRKFYLRRWIRLGVPYLLISGTWYGVKYLIIERDVGSFFYELSTISFWVEHKGAWYVAMLIPVYILYPFYYDWIERSRRKAKTLTVIMSILTVSLLVYFLNQTLYSHLSSIFNSLILFCIGHYIAKFIREEHWSPLPLFGFSVALFIVKTSSDALKNIVYIVNMSYAFFGAALAIAASWILDKLHLDNMNKVLGRLGGMSLELYLTNIFLIQGYDYFDVKGKLNDANLGGIPQYVLIAILGILLSIGFQWLSKRIISKFRKV